MRRHFSPRLDKSEEGQGWQQDGHRKEPRRHTTIPWLQPQPEIHAKTAMEPGQQHDQDLAHSDIGSEHPEPQDDRGVGIGHIKPGMGQTRPHDVSRE